MLVVVFCVLVTIVAYVKVPAVEAAFTWWDGEVILSNTSPSQSLELPSNVKRPSCLKLYVTGRIPEGDAVLTISKGCDLHIPEDLDKICRFDWYGGNATIRTKTSQDAKYDMRIKWKYVAEFLAQ